MTCRTIDFGTAFAELIEPAIRAVGMQPLRADKEMAVDHSPSTLLSCGACPADWGRTANPPRPCPTPLYTTWWKIFPTFSTLRLMSFVSRCATPMEGGVADRTGSFVAKSVKIGAQCRKLPVSTECIK